MVVKLRKLLPRLEQAALSAGRLLVAAYPHLGGLAGITAIVVGVWGLLGWEVALIVAGLPFAAFYVAGQALQVLRSLPKEG